MHVTPTQFATIYDAQPLFSDSVLDLHGINVNGAVLVDGTTAIRLANDRALALATALAQAKAQRTMQRHGRGKEPRRRSRPYFGPGEETVEGIRAAVLAHGATKMPRDGIFMPSCWNLAGIIFATCAWHPGPSSSRVRVQNWTMGASLASWFDDGHADLCRTSWRTLFIHHRRRRCMYTCMYVSYTGDGCGHGTGYGVKYVCMYVLYVRYACADM